MKAFAAAFGLFLSAIVFAYPVNSPIEAENTRYMAFCVDGDGSVSGWMQTRYEAYLQGRDHERSNANHHWEIWTEESGKTLREAVCSRIVDGAKPDTVSVENTCGKCVKFTIARTNADGSVNAREIKIQPRKSRSFRKTPNARFSVDAERDCSP